jgi:hypothetical protein
VGALRIAGVAVGLIALGGIAWLWSTYGAAVFLETIRAGFVACFG